MITLDTAVFEIYGEALDALRWYKTLSFQERQNYIDSLGIYRAQYIRDFTVDAMHFISERGENGFDMEALTDLWQRIRRKVHDHDADQSIR